MCRSLAFSVVAAFQMSFAAYATDVYDLAIDDVTVVSPERSQPLPHATVYISGDRIGRIETGGMARSASKRVSGVGRFLIPGLIDSHVHIASLPGPTPAQARQSPQLIADYRLQTPRSYLYFGFTTLIDLDASPDTRSWFEAGIQHPALYSCGRGVRILNGYGMNFVEPESRLQAFPNFVVDDDAGQHPLPSGLDAGAYTPEAAVGRVVQAGGICVKTYFERGFAGVFNLPVPSPKTLKAISTAAHARKLPVLLHATSTEAYANGLVMEADVLAHGLWHWPGPLTADLPREVDMLLDRVAAARVYVQPTLQVLHGEQAVINGAALRDPRAAEVVAPSLLAYLATPQASWYREELSELYARVAPGSDLTDEQAITVFVERSRRVTRELARRGARIIFGTDTPSSPGAGNLPGLNGYYEIRHLAQAGVPLDDLLQALTLRNAEAFGLDRDIGTVETGKRADLLLLAANPQVSADAYDAIVAVILRGTFIPRGALAANDHRPTRGERAVE